MQQLYDMLLLVLFIVIICTFMFCCQKRTERINEVNAKIFEMRAASPGESELEYEDIQSSDMDNDNNDDLELMEKGKKGKSKSRRPSQRNKKKHDTKVYQQKMNDISVCEDSDEDDCEQHEESKSDPKNAADADVFSDSTDDGMSMARMREEYYKSQTLTKKFTDLMDDIRDVLKLGQMQVQHKLSKKKPMIVVPMAIPSQAKMEKKEVPQVQGDAVEVKVKVERNKLLDAENKAVGQEEERQGDEVNLNVEREDEHSVESECEEKFDENSHGRKG
eukprot:CAMPEP_0197035916 /NCGR_PEP_ID=MMETSP1384-20130603/13572_1 /TAXON_ID=29189 /ORGANISM="Ammonia sp." /LENGTH=275 /DNA_ID=CAMNT_0042466025 /DNA_START=50 /DNA_END=877 /DNA_ORIENTATION=-